MLKEPRFFYEWIVKLQITQETTANPLWSHRDVITRMLRYFQNEEIVKLSRGTVTILNFKKLEVM